MSSGRDILRQQAKKKYKELIKNVPKRQRLSFPDFFKQFKAMHKNKQATGPDETSTNVDDFDFESLVNVNEIDDDSIEVIEGEEDTSEE